MADTNALGGTAPAASPVAAPATAELRTYAIVVYALYLAVFCSGLSAFAGLIVAYIKRGDARGTPYESHFSNAIEVFWVSLVISLVAVPLVFLFGLGLLVYCGLFIWYLFRTIKGLVRAIDGQPYY